VGVEICVPREHPHEFGLENFDSTMDVMMRLPSASLDTLRQKFNSRGNDSLTLQEFCTVMLEFLPPETKSRKLQLMLELIELYRQIDANGDENLSWAEFTSHCIEAGMIATKHNERPTTEVFEAVPWFQSPLSHHAVIQMEFLPEFNVLLVLEANSSKIQFVEATSFKLKRELQIRTTSESDGDKEITFKDDFQRHVVRFCFISDLKVVVACQQDSIMTFWSFDDFRFLGKTRTKPIRKMFYSKNTKRLHTTDDSGNVFVSEMRIKFYDGKPQCICIPRGIIKAHETIINAIAESSTYKLILTGAMDAKINLWDNETRAHKGTLKKHKRGVTCLVFSEANDLLLSAGFELEIFCWDLFNKQVVLQLKGHHFPPNGITLVNLRVGHSDDFEEHAVTCDEDGIFKVWGLTRVAGGDVVARQSFVADHTEGHFKPFLFCICNKRLICANRELRLFQTKSTYLQEAMPFVALMNLVLERVYVSVGNYIETWSAYDGTHLEDWYGISCSEITTMCLDSRKRKLIFGNANGEVICLNAFSGVVMKKTTLVEKNQVSAAVIISLLYDEPNRCLIAVTSCSIFVIDEDQVKDSTEGPQLPLLRVAFNVGKDIRCAAFNQDLSQIAVGFEQFVRVWEYQSFELKENLSFSNGHVTALEFFDHVLIVGNDLGGFTIWQLFPTSKLIISNGGHLPITFIKALSRLSLICTADHVGNVKLWRVNGSMREDEAGDEKTNLPCYEESYVPRRKCEVDCKSIQPPQTIENDKVVAFRNLEDVLDEVLSFSGHDDEVRYMDLFQTRVGPALLTTSADGNVRVFDGSTGDVLGQLTTSDGDLDFPTTTPWAADLDHHGKRLEKLEEARKMLSLIEEKRRASIIFACGGEEEESAEQGDFLDVILARRKGKSPQRKTSGSKSFQQLSPLRNGYEHFAFETSLSQQIKTFEDCHERRRIDLTPSAMLKDALREHRKEFKSRMNKTVSVPELAGSEKNTKKKNVLPGESRTSIFDISSFRKTSRPESKLAQKGSDFFTQLSQKIEFEQDQPQDIHDGVGLRRKTTEKLNSVSCALRQEAQKEELILDEQILMHCSMKSANTKSSFKLKSHRKEKQRHEGPTEMDENFENSALIGVYPKTEILNLKLIFDRIDTDESGLIDLEEIMDSAAELKVDPSEMPTMFTTIDGDHSGCITFREMLALFFPSATSKELKLMEIFVKQASKKIHQVQNAIIIDKERQDYVELFRLYDKDRSGTLSLIELFEALNGVPFKPRDAFEEEEDQLVFSFEDVEVITSRKDISVDQNLSEAEFVDLMIDFHQMPRKF